MNHQLDRRRLIHLHGQLYKRKSGIDWGICVYCGYPATCWDHVPALIHTDNLNIKQYLKNGGTFTLYPSCSECNRLLGDTREVSIYERLRILQGKYDKKASQYEIWTQGEIRQLGRTLRTLIETGHNKAHYYVSKLTNVSDKMDLMYGDIGELEFG